MSSNEIKAVLTIVDRGKGDAVIEFLREHNVFFSTAFLGRGTAASAWAELWTGESKKDIVISVVPKDRVEEIMKSIVEHFQIHKAGHGIAFSVDIGSISGKRALDYCLFQKE